MSHYPKDVPFEVPEGWKWCLIKDIADVARGGSPRPIEHYLTNDTNGVNWIKIGDAEQGGKYINSTKQRIRKEGVSRSRFVHAGDFLLTNSMSYGRPYILNVDGCIHDGWLVISPILDAINKDFFFYLLSSDFAYQQFSEQASGAVVSNLNKDKVADAYIPLPPYREQVKIVKVIEAIKVCIDNIEIEQNTLSSLLSCSKEKILELAIHGKLIPQDPNDEPATALLRRINPAFKASHNLHYHDYLPNGWCAIALGEVAEYINGRAFKPEEWENEGLPIVRIQNLNDISAKYNYSSRNFEDRYLIHSGDILFAWAASLNAYLWNGEDAWLNQHIFKVIPKKCILTKYLFYTLKAKIHDFYQGSHGSGMVHITRNTFLKETILLPPLSEQERIIVAIEDLFSSLDSFTACFTR